MFLTFPAHIISLVRFAQNMAERLAVGFARRLGIGRFGHTVFLPREEHQKLDAEIGYIELLTRRALFLIAVSQGAATSRAARRRSAAGEIRSARRAPPGRPPRAPLPRPRRGF